MDLEQLKSQGWMLVDGVSSHSDLLDLGRMLGTPTPSPNGELVKVIRRSEKSAALPGRQSAIYGRGPFPLHTDTVFWAVPVKYVILRASGDIRRVTTTMKFSHLLERCGSMAAALAEKSIWVVGSQSKRFYCSMKIKQGDAIGWRYDADLMAPANDAARKLEPELRRAVFSSETLSIPWSGTAEVDPILRTISSVG